MSEWKKVKIGDICRIIKGTTGIASAEPGEYPLVVTAEERKTCSSYQFDQEAVCIPLVSSSGHGKKSLKNVHYQSGKFALGTILCAVIPNNPEQLDARFLHQYLQFYKDTILVPLMKGAANVSLSMKDIATVEIPLPPIEKQRELSNLFITLQENQKKIDAESKQQLEYTKLLRQNILQDSIEGKLTADLPCRQAGWRKSHPVIKGNPDYDAEALFEKIQKEKAHGEFANANRLTVISKRKVRSLDRTALAENLCDNEEKPFEIPDGWKWVRLGDVIISDIGGGTPSKSNSRYWNGSIPWMTVKDYTFNKNGLIKTTIDSITEDGLRESSSNYIKAGNIIVCMRMGLGKIAINEIGLAINQDLRALFLPNYISKQFFVNFYKTLSIEGNGMTVKGIKREELINTPFPLPPLKEQEEIVTKVETLLAKVTELENQIQERKILSEKLAFGIIKENLEG